MFTWSNRKILVWDVRDSYYSRFAYCAGCTNTVQWNLSNLVRNKAKSSKRNPHFYLLTHCLFSTLSTPASLLSHHFLVSSFTPRSFYSLILIPSPLTHFLSFSPSLSPAFAIYSFEFQLSLRLSLCSSPFRLWLRGAHPSPVPCIVVSSVRAYSQPPSSAWLQEVEREAAVPGYEGLFAFAVVKRRKAIIGIYSTCR